MSENQSVYLREYYIKNKERISHNTKKYRKLHHDDIIKKQKERRRTSEGRNKLRTYNRQYNITHKSYWIRLIELLGKKCVNKQCLIPNGCTDIRCLQIDHINGGGIREIKEIGSIRMYKYYLNNPDEAKKKLQVLCANCNWIKRVENKEVIKPLKLC